jgi:hypothetical protein
MIDTFGNQSKPITENEIYKKLQLAEGFAREVYERRRTLAIITGLPGVGKSEVVRRVGQEFRRRWNPIKPASVPGFLDVLYNNRFEGIVLVGDDTTDLLWSHLDFLNIMKVAYDSHQSRMLRHDVVGKHGKDPFPIKSALILISNINFNDPAVHKHFGKLWPHVKAVLGRAGPALIDLTFDNHRALYEYSCWVGIEQQMIRNVKTEGGPTRKLTISVDETNEVLRLFCERHNYWKFGLTPRTLETIARERIGCDRQMWLAKVETMLAEREMFPTLQDLRPFVCRRPEKRIEVKYDSSPQAPEPTGRDLPPDLPHI